MQLPSLNEKLRAVKRNRQEEFEIMRIYLSYTTVFNLLKPTGHVIHKQFNIQQLYALPTLYICALYLSENKQRIAPLTA